MPHYAPFCPTLFPQRPSHAREDATCNATPHATSVLHGPPQAPAVTAQNPPFPHATSGQHVAHAPRRAHNLSIFGPWCLAICSATAASSARGPARPCWKLVLGSWDFACSPRLSTIASNLRTSSPNLHLTTCLQSTCRIGGTPAENLRTCYLSTPGPFLSLPPRLSGSPIPAPSHSSAPEPLHAFARCDCTVGYLRIVRESRGH